MNKVNALAVALLLIPSLGATQGLEGRVTRLENILDNQRASDMLLEIQRLQQEVQQLRGLVEQQQYELETLKRQQTEQYMDLDARLQGQGGAVGAAPAMAPAAGGTAAPAGGSAAAGGGLDTSPRPGRTGAPDLSLPPAEGGGAVVEKDAYREAFDLLKQRRYDEAIAAFEDLLARYPNGEFADNARYWLGETHYVKRDYQAAVTEFQRVLANYPLSPKVPGAMLKIGYIQDEQNDWSRARATLEDLMRKFPDTTEARLAKGRLDRMARDGR